MTNSITIIGEIKDCGLSHISHGKKIYKAMLEYTRPSGSVDHFKVYYEDYVKVPESKFVLVEGELRETSGARLTETTIHAYKISPTVDSTYENVVEIEGYVVRHGFIRHSKNIPFLQTILRCDRENGKASDYLKLTVFGEDALEVFDNGKGRHVSAVGRLQESNGGTQITTRGIEWK